MDSAQKGSFRRTNCRSCGGQSSPFDFDVHSTCQKCRLCTRENTCGICSGWSAMDWKDFTAWQDRLANTPPVVSSSLSSASNTSGASGNTVVSSYDRPISTPLEQHPSIPRSSNEFRGYPTHPSSFSQAPSWPYFHHNPRNVDSTYPMTMDPRSIHMAPPREFAYHEDFYRPSPDAYGSRPRSRSPLHAPETRSESFSHSSDDSDQDFTERVNMSMVHRGKLVIPEMSRLLQLPLPSCEEPSRASFRRESARTPPPPKLTTPVDAFCSDIIEDAFTRVQKKRRLQIPTQESSLFRSCTEDYEKFFTVPSISSVVKDKLRSGKPSKKSIFPDKRTKDLNSALERLDRHSRHGAQVCNTSILLSDALARSSEDPGTVDPDLLPVMFKFLDDCLGSCLRAFATTSAISSSLRRSLIMDQLYWPSQGSKERMEELPLIGDDLSDSKFEEVLLQEAKLLKTEEKTHPATHSCASERQRKQSGSFSPLLSKPASPTKDHHNGKGLSMPPFLSLPQLQSPDQGFGASRD